MKLSEIAEGNIFTIGETPSYPKLRTDYGYIDMRDEIKRVCTNLTWNIRIMEKEEVAKEFDIEIETVETWIKELSEKALISVEEEGWL